MSSILDNTDVNKIFLIYGHLDDMFISRNLQKTNFRPLLNDYLKSIGYEQIVYYSGAKNLGKFVLDDESAMLSINKNREQLKQYEAMKSRGAIGEQASVNSASASPVSNAQAGPATPSKRKRILSPREKKKQEMGLHNTEVPATPQPAAPAGAVSNTQNQPAVNAQAQGQEFKGLVYKQPKITPVEFLEDAKKMMTDKTHKSAVVFTFFQDFFTDRSAPIQPYLELVSHLWDEYSHDQSNGICIFLAPQMSAKDLGTMFDGMENGFVLKNRFFNSDGMINSGTAIEIGLPGIDEFGNVLEYLRIIGDKGKRISFEASKKKKLTADLLYFSREAQRDVNRTGYLHAVYNKLVNYISSRPEQVVEINEKVIKELYSQYKDAVNEDPLEKLKNTKGWEAVAARVEEILMDYRMKKARALERSNPDAKKISKSEAVSNGRLDSSVEKHGYKYPIPHFILKGNPGVGKTTVARLIGQIFYNEGILERGSTIEAKRDDLVGQYVGETAIKTTDCINNAIEGVLFIDDAYSLVEKNNGNGHSYAQEAIDTIVPIMTNPEKYRFCMIMAGYPGPMDELLAMNSGLKSRFTQANILTIEDYKPDLLQLIFENNCKKEGYKIDEALDMELFFTNLYNQRDRADFGNARDIVALAKEVMLQCSLRDDEHRIITEQDFGESARYFVKRGASSIDEIYAKIDKYVGMEFVKKLFTDVRYEVLDARDCRNRGITPEVYPDHFIFSGNPGTGKTTVGKMIGEFYNMLEVLGGTETMFVDASDIIGSHVGESKDKIVEVMQRAIDKNCVLYIDEAYQITESAYGGEIIGAMMTKMTENADDFKVIFGMYANKVEDFLKLNAGLARRLRIVNFPDYNPDQLLEIFLRSVKAQGCTITDEAKERMKLIFTRKYNVRGEDFGNAGEVKKILVDMKRKRLERFFTTVENQNAVDDANRYEYILADIPEKLLKSVEDMVNPKTLEDIMKELDQQIGLVDLKDIIIQKQEDIIFAQKSGSSTDDVRPGYYFFVGNPGTGKSTSAKLFAECLCQMGVVKTNNFYSCTAKDLIGQYVGETDKKAYELLKKSINGVLFIDEAYSLSYEGSHSDVNYKKEALEQIIAFMDEPEHRKKCCIIMAGYEKDMQGLYKSNSGMRSRIEEVHFRDYTADEAYDIFALFCKKGGFTISEGIREIYVPIFEELKKNEYYSNGRTARTIYEKTTAKLKRRVVRTPDLDMSQAKVIISEDLLSVDEAIKAIGV